MGADVSHATAERFRSACGRLVLALALLSPIPARALEPVTTRYAEAIIIGGEIRTRAVARGEYDFRSDRSADVGAIFQRSRVSLDAIVRPNLDVFLQAQDARAFGDRPPEDANATTSVQQAYVSWRRIADRFDVHLGRQELRVADERLIGASDWSQAGQSFDALVVDYRLEDGHRLTGVAAIGAEGAQEADDDRTLGGLVYARDAAFADKLQFYLLMLSDQNGGASPDGDTLLWNAGIHLEAPLGALVKATIQANVQFGQDAGRDVEAWATHVRIARTLGGRLIRSAGIEFNFASGDENPSDRRVATFHQMYPTNHAKYGIADHAGYRNLVSAKAGLRGRFTPNLSWAADGIWIGRHRSQDDFYQVNGGGRGLRGRGGRSMGVEVDGAVSWRPSTAWSIEAGAARLFLGSGLEEAIRSLGGAPADADFGYLEAKVLF